MTAVRYTVVCEHPSGPWCHVADITDYRPEGGVHVEEFRDLLLYPRQSKGRP